MLGRVGDEPAESRWGPLRRWFAWRRPRSFRQKLALSIAMAALLTAFIEGALDIFFDAQVARFRQENTDLLSQESATIALFLRFDDGEVSLNEEALERLEPDTRFQLLQDGEVVLTGPDPFPDDNNAWAVREGFVGGDYRLEIARPTSRAERFILNELWLDLFDLPLFFLLALVVAWLLSRFALRPIRELTRASRAMAQQVSPTPIEVPPGDDELSEMARSFNLMQTSVQRLLERERAFTRYASHELRTPLSTFKVQLEALTLGLSPSEQVLPVLERNVARMEAVLAALLALARSGERNPERAALEPLLRDLLGSLPPEARARISYRPALGERARCRRPPDRAGGPEPARERAALQRRRGGLSRRDGAHARGRAGALYGPRLRPRRAGRGARHPDQTLLPPRRTPRQPRVGARARRKHQPFALGHPRAQQRHPRSRGAPLTAAWRRDRRAAAQALVVAHPQHGAVPCGQLPNPRLKRLRPPSCARPP